MAQVHWEIAQILPGGQFCNWDSTAMEDRERAIERLNNDKERHRRNDLVLLRVEAERFIEATCEIPVEMTPGMHYTRKKEPTP
jgi:hypothetical protein